MFIFNLSLKAGTNKKYLIIWFLLYWKNVGATKHFNLIHITHLLVHSIVRDNFFVVGVRFSNFLSNRHRNHNQKEIFIIWDIIVYRNLTLRKERNRERNISKMCDNSFSQLFPGHVLSDGDKPYLCTICDRSFSQPVYLRRHLRAHSGEKPFRCSFCAKCFSQEASYEAHIRTHTGDMPYNCTTCDSSFGDLMLLRRHMKTHIMIKPFKCTLCEKTFGSVAHLKEHTRIHTGEKPHMCTLCEKSFSHLPNLKEHMRIHTGERPYQCTMCDRSFSHLSHLKEHTRTHTGEKPYKCLSCDRSFNRQSNLTKHVRIHSGEKPYKCLLCEKTFSQLFTLQCHIKTHTGDRPSDSSGKRFVETNGVEMGDIGDAGEGPYDCSYCEKSFSLLAQLTSHHQMHDADKPYKCLSCMKSFRHLGRLKRHVLTHDAIDQPEPYYQFDCLPTRPAIHDLHIQMDDSRNPVPFDDTINYSFEDRLHGCGQCLEMFGTKEDTGQHISHNDGNARNCEVEECEEKPSVAELCFHIDKEESA